MLEAGDDNEVLISYAVLACVQPQLEQFLSSANDRTLLQGGALIMGIDANCYEKPIAGKQLSMTEFARMYGEHGCDRFLFLSPSR